MPYPTDYLSSHSPSYPIKCYSGFSDGFSGWYAVSDPRQCRDFCYWELELLVDESPAAVNATAGRDDGENGSNSNGSNSSDADATIGYDATNVADPHQATFLSSANYKSSWRCALDVADESTTWSDVGSGRARELTPRGYFGAEFRYLQCHKGAGEVLEGVPDIMAKSGAFWAVSVALASAVIFVQIGLALLRKRRGGEIGMGDSSANYISVHQRRRSSLASMDENLGDDEEGHTALQGSADIDSEHEFEDEILPEERQIAIRSTKQRRLRLAFVLLIVNVGIAAVLTISVASLIDIGGKRSMSARATWLTPKCYDPGTECAPGNSDIDRPSSRHDPSEEDDSQPFSYLVMSDSQLDWYSGESPDIGQSTIPGVCSEADSCSSCSAKVGRHTNEQMRLSAERLLSGENVDSSSSSPIPNTLVLNGDLTAYFHPDERSKYESIYHDVEGLEAYFPALGNHELDLHDGLYGADQWIGSPYCNSKHAIGYVRSGFCGEIPKFDPNRIVRFDASSLAYSWEEGRYHFVHAHFFPAFEAAGLGLRSSVAWLGRDIALAYEAGLTTVLFVHAAQGLNDAMQNVLLGKNVAAIFAGHTHRCLMRKCIMPSFAHEDEVVDGNGTRIDGSEDALDKCLPGTAGICTGNAAAGGMNMYYLSNTSDAFELPTTKLFWDDHVDPDRKECPAPRRIFINETDNTMLCRRGVWGNSDFPPRDGEGDEDGGEHIPIFWSGSASFETFLKVDFYEDRFVVSAMTAEQDKEGNRYVESHEVPNAVYPYHVKADMQDIVVKLAV